MEILIQKINIFREWLINKYSIDNIKIYYGTSDALLYFMKNKKKNKIVVIDYNNENIIKDGKTVANLTDYKDSIVNFFNI